MHTLRQILGCAMHGWRPAADQDAAPHGRSGSGRRIRDVIMPPGYEAMPAPNAALNVDRPLPQRLESRQHAAGDTQ